MKKALRALATALVDNVRTLLYVAGFGLFYVGLSGLSRPTANIAAGLILMAMGVIPYWLRAKRG